MYVLPVMLKTPWSCLSTCDKRQNTL